MGKTIIQTIGPLYGDVVNGTVFGRPNGSIFIPSTNSIELRLNGAVTVYYRATPAPAINLVKNADNAITRIYVIAESQDIASYMEIQMSDDSDFSTYGKTTFTAGLFNISATSVITSSPIEVTEGTTYYIRAVLYASTGEPVATSDVYTLTGAE